MERKSYAFYLYMDAIEPRLYLGSEEACEAHVKEAKITHVLSLREPEALKCSLAPSVAHFHIVIEDDESENILQHLMPTHRWIQSALSSDPDARVLVHCRAGISRSATIIAHHLMQAHGIADDVALERVRKKREVDPNQGFRWQLRIQALAQSKHADFHPHMTELLAALPPCFQSDLYIASIIFSCLFLPC